MIKYKSEYEHGVGVCILGLKGNSLGGLQAPGSSAAACVQTVV